ncbi:MAG: DUF4147 domain-containing protein [Chloroflexi bacterium]|nr:DUF4147 domain-containing protein [Chloroflexota bacterium]
MQNEFPDEFWEIINSSLQSVNPQKIIFQHVRKDGQKLIFGESKAYDLSEIENIYIVGAGKAAAGLVNGLNQILGERITGGLVITKHDNYECEPAGKVLVKRGNHPVPGDESIESSIALADFTHIITEKDLVICLVTGGGSALMTLPAEGLSLFDLQITTGLLLECGATINEMNTIRKHLDLIKGGGLARLLFPAQIMALILSDVIGNPLEIIASGPTVADESTFLDAWKIIQRYGLAEKISEPVRQYLRKGMEGGVPETVKAGSQFLQKVDHLIVGDNRQACRAALQKSRDLGFNSLLLTSSLHGEARNAGIFLSSILREIAETGNPIKRPACIIAGGETTGRIRGRGLGGRNQEMALGAVKELAGLRNVAFMPIATDGEDGPTDAAGAVVTGNTYYKGLGLSLDPEIYLANNDSWHYFRNLGASIITGPTGTNVNDICFMFAY